MPSTRRQRLESLTSDHDLSGAGLDWCRSAGELFALRVPPAWWRKVESSGDPAPLLRQVLPAAEELVESEGYSTDPLREAPVSADGLVQKYAGRLLLMVTRTCSGHCRFCFRRHHLDTPVRQAPLQDAFRKRMANSGDISEVILSGGDPLVLGDRKLAAWFDLFARYPQLRRIRIHTREPVFAPERITPELTAIFTAASVPVVMAVHVNHPDELDRETARSLERLLGAGVRLLTQTVLLKDVNDSAETLRALFERSWECGMTPYYLHQLDRVSGAAHFEVDSARGLEIIDTLRKSLPGYLVPRFVAEVPGEASKIPLG